MAARRASEAGLSLVEVMMVLFIVALLSGVVLLSRPPSPEPIDVELEQLTQTATALADQALLTGQPHALQVRRDGYQGFSRRDGAWMPLRRQSRDLARRFRLVLVPDEETDDRRGRDEEPPEQQIIFDGVGAPVGGSLEIHDGPDRRRLDLSLIAVPRADEAPL